MRIFIITALLLLFCATIFALVGWQEPLRIAEYQNISFEFNSYTIPISDGGIIYAWSQESTDSRCIYITRIDAAGNSVWDEPMLLYSSNYDQYSPYLCRTSDGNIMVFWQENARTKVQKFDEAGQLLWVTPVDYYAFTVHEIKPDHQGGVYILRDNFVRRMNSNGVWIWNSWVALDNIESDYPIKSDVLPDNSIVFISKSSSWTGETDLQMEKINNDGTIASGPVFITTDNNVYYDYSINLASGSDYFITWSDYSTANQLNTIYCNKFNITGNSVWNQPLAVATNQHLSQLFTSVSGTSLIISWNTQQGIMAQKVSSDGSSVWSDAVCVTQMGSTLQSDYFICQPDISGGVYYIWRNGETWIYSQHIDSAGNITMGNDALLYQSTAINDGVSLSVTAGSSVQVLITFSDYYHTEILYQSVNLNGTLLAGINGTMLTSGLDGQIQQSALFKLGNKVMCLWITDHNNHPRLYHTLVTGDGISNGTLEISYPDNYAQGLYDFSAASSGSEVYVLNRVYTSPWDSNIIMQCFDSSGTPYSPVSGILVAHNATDYAVTCDGVAFYAFWVTNVSEVHQLRCQKYINGVEQWVAGGIALSYETTSDISFNANQRTVVWQNGVYLYSTRINPDGTFVQGWSLGNSNLVELEHPTAQQLVGNLIAAENGFFLNYYESGTEYDPHCEIFVAYYRYFHNPNSLNEMPTYFDVPGGITKIYDAIYSVGSNQICKTGFDGTSIWNSASIGINYFSCCSIEMNSNAEGVIIYLRNDNGLSAYYVFFDSTGNIILPTDGSVPLFNRGWTVSSCIMNNDFYAANMQSSYLELQKIIFGNVSDDDEILPEIPFISAIQMSPNPFSARIQLSFTVKEKVMGEISIYNSKGQRVRLLAKETLDKGNNTLTWDGKNDSGSDSGNGVFFYRIKSPMFVKTGKFVRIK